MASTSKTFPPVFSNGPNSCPFTTAYQLVCAAMVAVGINFEVPTFHYPSNLLGNWREHEGLKRTDFGEARDWLIRLLSCPPDGLVGIFVELLGNPVQTIARRRTPQQKFALESKKFHPILRLEGLKPLQEDIQQALNGFVGEKTVDGMLFNVCPRILLVELPLERKWHSRNLELEVFPKDYAKTKRTCKVNANMVGFVCDLNGHYTAVVKYGSDWHHTNCLTTNREITVPEAIRLFKSSGYLALFSCEKME